MWYMFGWWDDDDDIDDNDDDDDDDNDDDDDMRCVWMIWKQLGGSPWRWKQPIQGLS